MSYSNFATVGQITYSFRLEIDFGVGWVNISNFLEDISLVQKSEEDICGLITREIQVRLNIPETEVDEKWQAINTPIRCFLSANSFEELLFDGFIKEGSISQTTVSLDILDNSDRKLHREFGSFATDNFRLNDGEFLLEGDNEEGGTVFDTNYRPKPLSFEASNNQVANYLKFNKNDNNESGRFTINEMLKAIACFGGFNKDGVFKLKSRVWTNPAHQWDIRGLELNDTFENLSYQNSLNFNSILVKGQQFKGQSINIHLNIQLGRRTDEVSNTEVSSNSSRTIFLDETIFENIYFGYQQTPLRSAYLNIQANSEDDTGSSVLTDVYASSRAYEWCAYFDNVNRFGETASGFNFLDTTNFAVEVWLRPEETSTQQIIVSNRNASDRGQAIRIDPSTRRIQFVNHGIEAVSSNNNFFNWNETFCLLVNVNTTTKTVEFYKNGKISSSVNYVNNLVASTEKLRVGRLGGLTSTYYKGRMQELRIYTNARGEEAALRWHNRALIEGQTFNSTNDALKGYWRFSEASGSTVASDITGGGAGNITLNFTTRNNAILFDKLRAWQSTNLAFLSDYTSGSFNQTVTFTGSNNTSQNAFIKRIYIMAPGVYQKINDIRKTATGFNSSTEIERKAELESFYINDPDYAQTLANNLLNIYNNKKGIFSFSLPVQPRLMVGDIVLFKTPLGDKKGVVLTKNTEISKNGFLDYLKVKVLSDL